MGFLSKLTKAFGRGAEAADDDGAIPKEIAALHNDGRVHARYLIHGEGVARLSLDLGLEGVVHDVSYGGMAVRFGESQKVDFPAQLPANCKATLSVLDRSVRCSLQPVRHVPQNGKALFVGFAMQHESSETLIFMRELIEPLRCGKSLVALDRTMRHERYQSEDWSCLRGDGPTDMLIRTRPDATLAEALLTFRFAESYCELSYKDGVLRTGRSVSAHRSSVTLGSGMASTDSMDKAILQHAVFILLGAPTTCRQQVRPVLEEALARLSLKMEVPAA